LWDEPKILSEGVEREREREREREQTKRLRRRSVRLEKKRDSRGL
jgi:hypothetical protein